MHCLLQKSKAGIILFTSFCLVLTAISQELIPVSLAQKLNGSVSVVLGKIIYQETYTGPGNNIYTIHEIEVSAYTRAQVGKQISVITPGGVLGNRATVVNPSITLEMQKEYVFFLEIPEGIYNNKTWSSQKPIKQYALNSYPQGALVNENNYYNDPWSGSKTEQQLFSEIETLVAQPWKTPTEKTFIPRAATVAQKPLAIISFAPNPAKAGTINPADYLTINGVGFGPTPGTVEFPNADNGGASTITPPQPSDYLFWSDGQIIVKVPTKAGTGTFSVNNTFSSPSPLTISYSLIDIYSNFLNFPVPTRQLPHLVNKNGLGGYTFLYNTTSGFAANLPAVAAFERALVTWRGATGVNFRTGGTTTLTNTNDGTNLILFGPTGGALAITVANYQGSGTTSVCDQQNTVWWINDIDIMFNNPPTATTTWQFGPALPSASQYDFQSVALHELGHAHNLGHVIAPGQVMHYAIANGATARTLSANDIAAGNEMMVWSSVLCFVPAGVLGPMTTTTANLPVHFLSFTGRRTGRTDNLLEWKTADEENNNGFFVQRSVDGKDFKDLGFVSGTNTSLVAYQYEDAAAGIYTWFYRLRQVDFDGRQSYSAILNIKGHTNGTTVWSQGNKIYVHADLIEGSLFQLFTADGKLLLKQTIISPYTEIPIPGKGKGVLMYQFSSGNQQITGKILAQ